MSGNTSFRNPAPKAGRGLLSGVAIIAAVAALGWWVVSVNSVSVQTSLPESTQPFVVELPDPEPLIVTISPSRRADGTEVLVDGQSVAHPPGESAGQLVIALDWLEPGLHQIEIRVPRPTWVTESIEIEVEVVSGTARR